MNLVDRLKKGEIILSPTDTTFGLACLASNQESIQKIKTIKQRPDQKQFLILVSREAQLDHLVHVPEVAWDLLASAVKPLTIIYSNPKNIAPYLLADDGSIGIRWVKEGYLLPILEKVGQPIISTSANRSGFPNPETFDEISEEILTQVDYIAPETKGFKPKYSASDIIKINDDFSFEILRKG